jgi:hypothetical protein
MLARLTFATGLVLAAGTLAVPSASAATLAPRSAAANIVGSSLVEQARYRACRLWYHECGRRWGWRSPGYYRCLRRHGC